MWNRVVAAVNELERVRPKDEEPSHWHPRLAIQAESNGIVSPFAPAIVAEVRLNFQPKVL